MPVRLVTSDGVTLVADFYLHDLWLQRPSGQPLLLAVVANFYYLYPVLAGVTIPYTSWLGRMWFHSWI